MMASLGALLAVACATSALRDAKNAYNEGDWAAAKSAAERAAEGGDPQGHLVAARAATRLVTMAPPADTLASLTAIARDLLRASRGHPFGDVWADRELAAGIADWLLLADLPELAGVYYRAALEAPGEDIDPGEAAAAEGLVQAGLEALDRQDPPERERLTALRELARVVERLLTDTGFPYPPGLADQALRVAWTAGDYRAAWTYGAAGWLRAVAESDTRAAETLAGRLADLIYPDWREVADPTLVDGVRNSWERGQRAWSAADQ